MFKNKMRRLCLAVLLVATLITFFSVSAIPVLAADEPFKFKSVFLSVYPEYDDPLALGYPTVLVMLDGQIDGANPPATVRFLVPSDAVMNSAGSGPRSSYVGGPPDRKASGIAGWDEISYTLTTNYFVVEYYAPIPTSPNRDFSVDFIPLFDINGPLGAIVQEPRQATDFNVVTQNQTVKQPPSTDAEGFKIQGYSFGSLKSSQPISFHITYTKNSLVPSMSLSQGPSTTGLLVIFGTVMVVLLLVVLYQVRRNSSSRQRNRDRASRQLPTRKSGGGRFCTKCGARLDKSERFCPQCGTKQST